MPLKAPSPVQKERKMLEPGEYNATCFSVVDLGSKEAKAFDGSMKMRRSVCLTFEIHGQFIEIDGKQLPMVKSENYTLSMYKEANLRKAIKSRYGKDQGDDFDMFDLVGKKAKLIIIHAEAKNGNTYDNIDYIGMSNHDEELISDKVAYSIDENKQEEYEKLMNRQRKIISESPEFIASIEKENDDNLPF